MDTLNGQSVGSDVMKTGLIQLALLMSVLGHRAGGSPYGQQRHGNP